jgi:hypothetical protein
MPDGSQVLAQTDRDTPGLQVEFGRGAETQINKNIFIEELRRGG